MKSTKIPASKPTAKTLRSLSAADLEEVHGGVVLLRSSTYTSPSGSGAVLIRSSGWSTLQSPSRILSSDRR